MEFACTLIPVQYFRLLFWASIGWMVLLSCVTAGSLHVQRFWILPYVGLSGILTFYGFCVPLVFNARGDNVGGSLRRC